jgi:hypothetical protein
MRTSKKECNEIEECGERDSFARRQNARRDNRGNGVRCIVKSHWCNRRPEQEGL